MIEGSKTDAMTRKLRMGMIGGGPGAFIGEVHRKAARMDGQVEIVGGAFDMRKLPSQRARVGCMRRNRQKGKKQNRQNVRILHESSFN